MPGPETRRDALRAVLAERGVDAALVTAPADVRYLSGFTGSNGALLVAADGTDRLATDGRYLEQAAGQSPGLEVLPARAVAAALVAAAAGTVAYQAQHVTVALHADLVAAGEDRVELVELGPAVEELRRVKDDAELALLRTACEVTDAALADLLDSVHVGDTERALALRLETRFRELGADGAAFASIVAGGPHSAVPHHEPTDRPLAAGDLLKVDCGARWAGYCADTTRTVVVGAAPAGWQQEVHDVVRAAQRAGLDAVRPGAAARDVDAAARSVVEGAGWGERFVHGLGHGVGLEVHEAPLLAASSSGRIDARVPVTVEPGVYLPGSGGVRIEDVCVLLDDASRVELTGTGRELRRVG
ncbi:Xaa-Pro aminopeptidase [Motilibacter rhizosphaerae]|uniref:Xaa-Pro aminopeptidase n=1 Tax=Motilibacter rhizosphaerae TaxID=598652 RepID=A0A4Q7NQS8_9ACTN|nr:Xaa-Pro peptidase family protein [Motilibacter rhizosphaerae]RZS89406.1 Xaa-Pro aminopeptidase [Motilibacter rhizosphaerae]